MTTNSSNAKCVINAAETTSNKTKSATQSVEQNELIKKEDKEPIELNNINVQVEEEKATEPVAPQQQYFSFDQFDHEEAPNPEPSSPTPTTPSK